MLLAWAVEAWVAGAVQDSSFSLSIPLFAVLVPMVECSAH